MFLMKQYHAPDFNQQYLLDAPDVEMKPAPKDGVAPDLYHSMSIFPEYFKVHGEWLLAEESRMDCVPVYENGKIFIREFSKIHKGDMVILGRTENGSEGILVYTEGFQADIPYSSDAFAFRQSRSRETSFSRDYDELYDLLRYERKNGKIVWVCGPALVFDADAKKAMSSLIQDGYCQALFAGNALAVHDLEGSWLGTALGQDIYTRHTITGGHYHHLDTINRVRKYGSIARFLEEEHITEGVIYSCQKKNIPYVLAGSIRDDGPLPDVITNSMDSQTAMREQLKNATTVICLATMLHTIATGNMTPSYRVMQDGTVRPVFFFCIDISEFVLNKIADRGSLSARCIVTNAQDFIVNLQRNL